MRPGLLCVLLAVGAMAQPYDLVVRNARVVDGSAAPWFRASVAIRGGRIARIGHMPPDTAAARTIDAAGRFLAPGFIDIHTHIEGAINRHPAAENFLRDGVTSVVTGNCGGSAPDLAAWFSALSRSGLGINVASFIGHNTVRSAVIGSANRAATPDEIEKMRGLIDRAMRDGAVGLSTGLEYIPGAYAQPSEIIELAKIAAKHGGIYATHMRNEGEKVLDAIAETLAVGREARIPVEISHLKMDTRRFWGFAPKMLEALDGARVTGIDVTADQYPYDRSATSLSIRIPSWALADGRDAVKQRLANPATRAEIAAEMKRDLAARGNDDYSYATIVSTPAGSRYEGKTIPEAALLMGREPTLDNQIETIFELQLAGGADMVYQVMSGVDIEAILRWPATAIASDGGVRFSGESMTHPRSYGSSARILSLYVRQRKLLALEDAVRRMTSLPARTLGFHDRGLIREGFVADLVLFDLGKVRDASTYADPHRYSEGFDTVIVNGQPVIDDGRLSQARPGLILRGPGASRP